MSRLGMIIWLCSGALALGILVLSANRRQVQLSRAWYVAALLLGPIFFCFVVPLWLGKWGEPTSRNPKP